MATSAFCCHGHQCRQLSWPSVQAAVTATSTGRCHGHQCRQLSRPPMQTAAPRHDKRYRVNTLSLSFHSILIANSFFSGRRCTKSRRNIRTSPIFWGREQRLKNRAVTMTMTTKVMVAEVTMDRLPVQEKAVRKHRLRRLVPSKARPSKARP